MLKSYQGNTGRACGKTPVLPVRGPHVCSGASCYIWEKFSGCVQMY